MWMHKPCQTNYYRMKHDESIWVLYYLMYGMSALTGKYMCGARREFPSANYLFTKLTHSGRVTHICVGNLIIIVADNGLSPGRRRAIIQTNAGILLIGPLGRNFNEMLIEIHTFSFKKMHLKMWSAKWRPFCLGLNVLKVQNENIAFIVESKLSMISFQAHLS